MKKLAGQIAGYETDWILRVSLSILFIFLLLGSAMSQDVRTPPTEEHYELSWEATLKMTNLKFTMPHNYNIIKMAQCNFGTWTCKARHNTFFNRVIMNADSSVVIGVQIFSNGVKPRDQSGQIISKKIDWIKSAKIVLGNRMDTSTGYIDMDKALLNKNWGAIYGVKFDKGKCDGPYLGKSNNKHLLIASEDTQILIVYFYSDDFKDRIDSEVDKTIGLLLKN